MKKFFEKHDLIKLAGLMVILSVILTWIIPGGYFTGSELVSEEITRVGLTNFMQYGLLGIYYFTVLVTFLFVLGGFYELLSRTKNYRSLISRISKKLTGHEIIFSWIVSLIFALICSTSNEYFPIIVFIPFVITIFNRLKVNKLSAFASTFGALLVGTVGSICSNKVVGYINQTFGIDNSANIGYKIALFVVAYVALNVFNTLYLKKTAKSEENYDKFAVEAIDSKKKVAIWPYVTGAIMVFIVTVLAYLPWESWNVTVFSEMTDWVNNFSVADVPIISYIFGKFVAFGTWDIFTIQFVLLFATILIHWFGRVKFDELVDAYSEGFKKMAPVVIVFLIVYMVLEFSVMYSVVPVIVDWFATLTKGFNAFFTFIASTITAVFGVEMQYVTSLSGTYYAGQFAKNSKLIALIMQSTFGLVSFFVPSSGILMLGLSYLNIPYKDWMKYIWKFLVTLLVAVVIILILVAVL